jgi:hypothetical protein
VQPGGAGGSQVFQRCTSTSYQHGAPGNDEPGSTCHIQAGKLTVTIQVTI